MAKALVGFVSDRNRIPREDLALLAGDNRRLRMRVAELEEVVVRLRDDLGSAQAAAALRDPVEDMQPI